MEDGQRQIAEHYGIDTRLDLLTEECGELITAIAKLKRQADPSLEQVEHIAEEMADVENVMDQIKILMPGMAETVADYKRVKVMRQLFRIEVETLKEVTTNAGVSQVSHPVCANICSEII